MTIVGQMPDEERMELRHRLDEIGQREWQNARRIDSRDSRGWDDG